MEIPPAEPPTETEADRYPLLMERHVNCSDNEHIIDISRNGDASSSLSHDDSLPGVDPPQHEDRPSNSSQPLTYQTTASSPNRVNSRNSSLIRRSEGYAQRSRSPLNSGLWISVELVVTLCQIIAAIVVLSLSKHENPEAPLFTWVACYTSGCIATLPILYWRYRDSNQDTEQDTTHLHHGSSQSILPSIPASLTTISVSQPSEQGNQQTTILPSTNNLVSRSLSSRLNGLVNHFKMALDCFFAVWFVVGNVWIFGDHSSPSDAPKLYRVCIVFLAFSCVGYAMPFILCVTICCCLPCILSMLGVREDCSHTRGATLESINALPTYKFKLKKNGDHQDINLRDGEGGLVAAGTEKEQAISGEDAVCCICLAKYANNDELRELPCSHFFHVECVDKWLKINATCPLCKLEVSEKGDASPSTPDSSRRHSVRVDNGLNNSVFGITVF